VEWEDGKVSWEPESSLLQVRGTNKEARAARKEEMKEVAEELGNWEGLSWKEKAGAIYDGDEWEVLVGDEDGTVVEVKNTKEVEEQCSTAVTQCLEDFIEHAESMGGAIGNISELRESQVTPGYDAEEAREVKCFYLEGVLEEALVDVREWELERVYTEGEEYERLRGFISGNPDEILLPGRPDGICLDTIAYWDHTTGVCGCNSQDMLESTDDRGNFLRNRQRDEVGPTEEEEGWRGDTSKSVQSGD
jgi:hypothetical protein